MVYWIYWTILIYLIIQAAATYSDDGSRYEVGSKHGGNGGYEFTFECPFGGAITGINYRSAWRVDQLEFICKSSVGKTTFGPYGRYGGTAGSTECPQGHYVSSFFGRSADRLDRLGIRCRPENDMSSIGTTYKEFGGNGGVWFDDVGLSLEARPVSIKLRSADEIDAIQVTYANVSIHGKLCTVCDEYKEFWAPMHGGYGGTPHEFVCPAEGVITGIKYRSAWRLDSIEFICTSSLGETRVGPFGGNGGTAGEERCPSGYYISSIHGRSAERVDKLGIRCVKIGQRGKGPKRDGHGGGGGQPFDDENFAIYGRRPVQIRIRSAWEVDAIQIKYGTMPVTFNCRIARIDVTEPTITAKLEGFEVIGISRASSCSTLQQQITLHTSTEVTDTVTVETMTGGEFNWANGLSLSVTNGVNFGIGLEFSIGLTYSHSYGGSHTWSRTESKSSTNSTAKSQGIQTNYQGPGACIVVGFLSRYKIERSNIPVLYHFACDGGDMAPQAGQISLSSSTFGFASFQDYQYQFKSVADCTSAARACVAAIKVDGFLSDPDILDAQLKKCFELEVPI